MNIILNWINFHNNNNINSTTLLRPKDIRDNINKEMIDKIIENRKKIWIYFKKNLSYPMYTRVLSEKI